MSTDKAERELEILLNGSRVLIERIPMPVESESGIILPKSYVDAKKDVSISINADPYQKRGYIKAIGVECSERFKENFKVGDIVHFGPMSAEPALIRKDIIPDDTPYALLEAYSIHWKELKPSN